MPSVLALDSGTTGATALVIRDDGKIIGRGSRELPQSFPEPGWVEHDPIEILNAIVAAAREALAAAGEWPAGLGITNQRETTILWDRKTLAPVAPAIVWQDRRTAQRCRELKASGVEPRVHHLTGLVLDPYFSATKLEWLLREPSVRRRADAGELAFGTVDSWLITRLTGGRVHVTDHTNASRTLLYGLQSRRFEPELLELFGIPAVVLPGIVDSSGIVAETDPSMLGRSLLIAGIAGDQQAALFGQGCVRPGSAKNTYGTGAFLLTHTGDRPAWSSQGLLTTAACGPRGEPAYALEGSVLVAGAALQWLRDGLGILSTAAESESMARSVADTGGVHFVPAFAGLGPPHWEPEARGTITGLTRGTTRAHLVRAALEAMAYSSADLLDAMLRDCSAGLGVLRVDGGGSSNDWLVQFQADILGVAVERPEIVDSTAMGAGGLAGLALGVWPDMDAFISARRVRTFEPGMSAAERARLRSGWARAVGAAVTWARGSLAWSRAPE
ncbi:MAG: glycerol kinase GlpK [Gemmatimonadota bacterium]